MAASFILALDQGTSSSRAAVVNADSEMVAVASEPLASTFPADGWVEQDPEQIWESQLVAARRALSMSGLTAADIAAIGITNQRETTLVWRSSDGQPVSPAIVWQDGRTSERCEQLKSSGAAEDVRLRTGLVVDPYFSATKLEWLLQQRPETAEAAARGAMVFGTVDTYLLWRLTGGRVHATDVSNASRTMLWNLQEGRWDPHLLALFGVPDEMLPHVLPSSGFFGETDPDWFGGPIPITGIAGDQQAALFGQACFTPGSVKNTYGTGCFLLMNTGQQIASSTSGLLSTAAWKIDSDSRYALEGSVFSAGSAVQWLRDGLQLIESASDSEPVAASVEDTGGVYVVPAFTGLGAPYWDPTARGTIVGLTRSTSRAHIVRAVLESIAFQTCDVVACMETACGTPVAGLRVDGGASENNLLMQLQADLLGAAAERAAVRETTALGAAWLAGLRVGQWQDQQALSQTWRADRTFEPSISEDERLTRLAAWRRAVTRSLEWAQPAGARPGD